MRRRVLPWGAALLLVSFVVLSAWWLGKDGVVPARVAPVSPASVADEVASSLPRPAAPVGSAERSSLVVSPDAARPDEPVDVDAGASDVARLRGRVVDLRGVPVPGAAVRFAWHTNDRHGMRGVDRRVPPTGLDAAPPGDPVLCAADGRFTLDVPLAGKPAERLAETLLLVLHDGHALLVHRNPPLAAGDVELGELGLAPGGGVSGRVVDEDGRPLAGVSVMLRECRPDDPEACRSGPRWAPHVETQRLGEVLSVVPFARTGSDGRFHLPSVPSGRTAVSLSRDDRLGVLVEDVSCRPDRVSDLGEVVLARGAVIAGRVRLPGGGPAAGALVVASSPDPADVAEITVTGGDGRFELGGLQPGAFEVSARADGFPWVHESGVPTDRGDLELLLQPGGTLVLELRDVASGEPVEGAVVQASLPARWKHLPRAADPTVRTGPPVPAGEVHLDGVGREGVSVRLLADGYRATVLEAPGVGPGESRRQLVALEPALAVTGFVVDERDEPVSGASVQLAPRFGSAAGTGTQGTRTDESGAFRFGSVSEGVWTLWVAADGFRATPSAELTLPEQGGTPLIVRLERHALLEGVVTSPRGEPRTSVGVVVHRVARAAAPDPGVFLASNLGHGVVQVGTDERGAFAVDGLGAGEHVVVATQGPEAVAAALRGGAPPPENAVRVHLVPGEAALVRLVLAEGGFVEGVVTAAGQRLPGARVSALPRAATGPWGPAASASTDIDGTYRLGPLASGAYAVVVEHPRPTLPLARAVELEGGETLLLDVAFGGATLAGRVVDASSRAPVAGAEVWVHPAFPLAGCLGLDEDEERRMRQVYDDLLPATDAHGDVSVPFLPEGAYRVSAEAEGYLDSASERVGLGADGAQVTIALVRGAVVDAVVVDAGGEVAEQVFLELHDVGRSRRAGRAYPRDGRWVFAAQEAGSYELRAHAWTEQAPLLATRPLVLAAGRRHEIELRLP